MPAQIKAWMPVLLRLILPGVPMDSAIRRVGAEIDVAGAATQRIVFGPFLPFAERVVRAYLYLYPAAGSVPVEGDSFKIDLRVFPFVPLDTAAAFAEGRSLCPPSPLVNTGFPSVPVFRQVQLVLPIGFRPVPAERYLGFQLNSVNVAYTVRGSVWLEIDDTIYQEPEAEGDVTSLDT